MRREICGIYSVAGVDADPATDSVCAIFASIPPPDHPAPAPPRMARNLQ
jgi:hypothetical protein